MSLHELRRRDQKLLSMIGALWVYILILFSHIIFHENNLKNESHIAIKSCLKNNCKIYFERII